MLIHNVVIVNEGRRHSGAVLVSGEFIATVFEGSDADLAVREYRGELVDGAGGFLLPGVIDDQVHFREPGLTHKGDIFSESCAAAAGGVTSFMEMPNTQPQTLTQALLEEKYSLGADRSVVNFSFYMGASNDNLEEVKKTDPSKVCGIKVFMGASTGNMLVDDPKVLEGIFAEAPTLVAVHSEDEGVIRKNMEYFSQRDDVTSKHHPLIRSREACIQSTEKALLLAGKYNTRLHILHLSTAEEAKMMVPGNVADKRITSEVCVHHLWFSDEDYESKGNFIKWNPSIKSVSDRSELKLALLDDRIDVVATDHAPHTIEEKSRRYLDAPSGGPLVQHSLLAMLELSKQDNWPIEFIVRKMCHTPADLFGIVKRGYIRPGYYADLVLVHPSEPWKVGREGLLYKCGWSPMEGTIFSNRIGSTWVNGSLVFDGSEVVKDVRGLRLMFL